MLANVITVVDGESLTDKVLSQKSMSFAIINIGNLTTGLPTSGGVWNYTVGYSISRNENTKVIMLFDRYTGKIATKIYDNSKWSDWVVR